MLIPDKTRMNQNPVNDLYTLTRNNMEFAGLVVYFFAIAVLFAMALTVMLFQTGDETYVKAANDHQPPIMVSTVYPR